MSGPPRLPPPSNNLPAPRSRLPVEWEPVTWQQHHESDLGTYIQILRRRMRWVVGIFSAVVAAALIGTLLQPRTYRATGMLEISTQATRGVTSMDQLFAGGDPSEEHLRTQFGILRSDALAERVIRNLDLLDTEEFGEPPLDEDAQRSAAATLPDTSSAHPLMQRAVARFQERLTIDPVESSRLVQVSFESEGSARAAAVVNSVLSTFVAMRMEEGRRAAAWLDREMEGARDRVRSAEAELSAYADSAGLPFRIEGNVEDEVAVRLQNLEQQLIDAQAVRYERESLQNLVSRRGRADAVGDAVIEDLTMQLAELRAEYEQQSTIFTDDYPEVAALKRRIEGLEGLLGQERQRIVEKIGNDYQVALRNEQLIAEELAREQEAASALSLKSAQYHLLRQEVLSARNLYAALQDKRQEAEVSAAMEATGVSLVDRAVPPILPFRPVLAYNLALAAMLGLVAGIVGAVLRDRTDDTILTADDMDVGSALPVLGLIPSQQGMRNGHAASVHGSNGQHLSRGGRNGRSWPLIEDKARGRPSALADAFGALRSAVLFDGDGATSRSLLISSCRAGEGKTTVSVNLALSLARLNHRVLLIDADMRRPSLHRALALARKPGLAQCIRVGGNWWAAVQPTHTEGLEVLVSGGPADDAGDLVADPRMGEIIRAAEQEYHYVIVDAPALFINAPDARVLAHLVDGTIVVVRSESTPRALANRIREAASNVIGIIVNDLHPRRLPQYYGDYFADYSEDEGSEDHMVPEREPEAKRPPVTVPPADSDED